MTLTLFNHYCLTFDLRAKDDFLTQKNYLLNSEYYHIKENKTIHSARGHHERAVRYFKPMGSNFILTFYFECFTDLEQESQNSFWNTKNDTNTDW